MTGHMAGHAIHNKHDLGFSESGKGENLKYRISLNLLEYPRNKRELLLLVGSSKCDFKKGEISNKENKSKQIYI